jgi:multidrug efflux pump subunit AcrA (membrane-fusion protein)
MIATIHIEGKEYKGKIATIALSMDSQRRAFQVDVHFNNPKGEIKSGTSCDLIFKLDDNKKQSIVIPRRIIKIDGDEQFVFIAEGDVAKKTPIRMGQASGVNVEIIEGLKLSDKIISEGITLLESGKRIRIIQ